jgi:predicted transposase YdaD
MKEQTDAINEFNPKLDEYFKGTFSIIEVAYQLIRYIVPKKILVQLDLSTLELANETHVDENLRKSMTDLVYVCKRKDGTLARLCFLFEHKSSHPGRRIYPQVGRYLTCAQENDINKGLKDFSLTLPIFFYHGEEKWTPRPIMSLYGDIPNGLKEYVPNFKFLVVNLQEKSRKQILAMEDFLLIRNIFLVMKRSWDDNFFRTYPREIVIFAQENVREEILMKLFDLTLSLIQQISNLNKTQIMEIAAKLPPTYANRAKTTYEYLIEEGMEKGMEKGKEIGKEEILKAYMLKFPHSSNEDIASIFNVSLDFVQKIRFSINTN